MKTSWSVYYVGGFIVCVVALYALFVGLRAPRQDVAGSHQIVPSITEEQASSSDISVDTPVMQGEVVLPTSSSTPPMVHKPAAQEPVTVPKTAVSKPASTIATPTPVRMELAPVRVTHLTPQEGPVETVVTLAGENFGAGDDVSVWMVHSAGTKGYLQAPYGDYLIVDSTTIQITVPEYMCTSDPVGGGACTRYAPIQPGTYVLSVERDGQASNQVPFTVTGADCVGLTESMCYQTPGCGGRYGPSECSGDVCTDDESFQSCYTLPPRLSKNYEWLFADAPPPPLTYTTPQDWPPVADGEGAMNADCPIGKDEYADMPTYTTEEVKGDTTYCITRKAESAAGSTHAVYTYTATRNDERIRLWFSLRLTNCGGYADERVGEECTQERETFDLTDYIDGLVRPVWDRLKAE